MRERERESGRDRERGRVAGIQRERGVERRRGEIEREGKERGRDRVITTCEIWVYYIEIPTSSCTALRFL